MIDFSLTIDPVKIKGRIVSFIKEIHRKRDANGLLVIFSGQIDSFTVAKLSIEALGLDSVKLAIVSDVSSARRKEIFSSAQKFLNVSKEKIIYFDMRKNMNKLDLARELFPKLPKGFPSFYLRNIGNLTLQTQHVQDIFKEKTYDLVGKPRSEREKIIQEIVALNKFKKRLKTALAYLVAERQNLLLVNKTNKTEWLTGLFVEHGYGHSGDLMPLGDLYRTQVLQMAEYLEVPKQVRELVYSDILPELKNKYQYFFNLQSDEVDQVLIRLKAGWSANKIARNRHIRLQSIEKVKHFFEISKYQRMVPLIPKLD